MKANRNAATALLLTAWGVGTIGAFWHLEWQYLRPVARPEGALTAKPDTCPPPPVSVLVTDRGEYDLRSPGTVTLINFWNPSCPCSRYMETHVARLAATYEKRGVRFVTVVECGETNTERTDALKAWKDRSLDRFAVAADPGSAIACAFGVWAAPAAVILNQRGRITYVGAYNAARFCDARRTAWAEQALASTVDNKPLLRSNSPFFGCQVLAAAPPAAPSHDLSKSKQAAFAAILSLRFHQRGRVRR